MTDVFLTGCLDAKGDSRKSVLPDHKSKQVSYNGGTFAHEQHGPSQVTDNTWDGLFSLETAMYQDALPALQLSRLTIDHMSNNPLDPFVRYPVKVTSRMRYLFDYSES